MKKATLGRGLDSLIPTEETGAGFFLAGIQEIKPSHTQPRKEFDIKSIKELSDSIKEKGVVQPLIVRKTSEGYELIAGERRWRAAQLAGIKKVPVILKDVSDKEAFELALIENLQREDLNPIEEAIAYEQLMNEYGLTHEEIGKELGKNRSSITNQIRLLKLSDEAKEALVSGEITPGHARAILALETEAERKTLLNTIRKQKLNVRHTEALIQKKRTRKPAAKSGTQVSGEIKEIVDRLTSSLGTRVRINDKNGKGKIEIEYHSTEELERLYEILTSR